MQYIHLWMKLGSIKSIYPIEKRKAKITEDDLKDVDEHRFVEVPEDYMKKLKLEELGLKSDDIIVVERRQTKKEMELYKNQTIYNVANL